ncbi:hypothetical protein MPTK2_8g13740 [Marchantia polymorpha subsp. ruderalis]
MEEWRSTSAGSKDESGGGGASIGGGGEAAGAAAAAAAAVAAAGGGGGGGKTGSAAEVATPPPATVISKRQRRPSVRLGEIGDQKISAKAEVQANARWMSPNFVPRKSNSANGAKLPRTRPLANVTRGEIAGQAAKAGKEGSDEGTGAVAGTQTPPVVENSAATEEEEEAEAPGAPSSTGRGNYGATGANAVKKGKHGKRKRPSSIKSSTIAKTLGVVSLNRKAKELQKVLAVPDVIHPGAADNADTDMETPPVEMEEESGAARAPENFEDEGGDHAQNGDTEVLEDDGNGEDSSGRQEGDEPESPGVRDNQLASMNGAAGPVQEFVPAKDDREQCTSRLTDGDKERKNVFMIREASMNGRRGGVRGWLGSLGLDKYADLFEENEVDNDVLPLLTFEDLKEMGIVAVGARRKMFAGIQELGRLC